MADYKIIEDATISDKEQDELDFEDYIKGLDKSTKVYIFRVDNFNKRWKCGILHSIDLENDDIYELVEKMCGGGQFFIQPRIGRKWGAGRTLYIEENKRKNDNKNHNDIDDRLKNFEDKILSIVQAGGQTKDSEMQFLEKLEKYKALFSSPGGGFDMQNVMKDMMKQYKEGFEFGKSIKNPEPTESDPMTGILSSLMPLFMQKMTQQPIQQPVYIPQPPIQNQAPDLAGIKKTEEPKINDEAEEMKVKYLSLIFKLQRIAKLPEGEEKDSKIGLVIDELFEFYPELIDNFDKIEDIDTAFEMVTNSYGFKLSDAEKKLIKRIYAEISQQIKGSPTNAN